ncbi:MAG: heat-inducible transcriptional repressor HrcA [Coleofasciculaceae cyanobacterium SM2_1_6]|nr:heat-inducible transcriptional repressor HrcA [Coleofasciculaceae cyanobacterium SM2_1_6]
MQVSLSDRQQHILACTVRHYIATAEPVGSKVLAADYNLNISPATIRACLGMLEKEGLLYQPHTSSGRVPSDSGYRIYVDQLLAPEEYLNSQLDSFLRHCPPVGTVTAENRHFDEVVRGAAQILATLSGYITLITLPQALHNHLRHLQLVQVAPAKVMLIVVTDNYLTQSVLMDLPLGKELPDGELVDRELQILSNFLLEQLRGQSLGNLAKLDWQELDRQFAKYADFLRDLLRELQRRSQPTSPSPIMIHGLAEALRLPEFSELQQVQMLLHLLEQEQEQVWQVIFDASTDQRSDHPLDHRLDARIDNLSQCSSQRPSQRPSQRSQGQERSILTTSAPFDFAQGKKLRDLNQRRVKVVIGAENPLEPMRSYTLIAAPYQQGTINVGSVGVLGPTRMLYEKAIALVEATADYLSASLS